MYLVLLDKCLFRIHVRLFLATFLIVSCYVLMFSFAYTTDATSALPVKIFSLCLCLASSWCTYFGFAYIRKQISCHKQLLREYEAAQVSPQNDTEMDMVCDYLRQKYLSKFW